MSKSNDGGAAFPLTLESFGGQSSFQVGMTLRDYFAAKALLGQLSYGECVSMEPASVARFAYECADAMLAEREKAGEQ